jgi:hypothetical protein
VHWLRRDLRLAQLLPRQPLVVTVHIDGPLQVRIVP